MAGYLIATVLMILADFFTKLAAIKYLKPIKTFPVIKDVFHFTFCKNTGAAFSMFSGKPYTLAAVSIVVIFVIIVCVIKYKPTSKTLMWALSMIVAGGLGNVIDRVSRGYVVDFFDFRIINFAIFNVADIFVCTGTFLLGIYLFFIEGKMEKKNDI